MRTNRAAASLRVLALAGLFQFASPALAQDASAPAASSGDGDIVVTAQKREQSIQSVGLAISAMGQQSLAEMGRQDMSALAAKVPSLQVLAYSPTLTVFNIRGVSQNDFADSQEAPIAFYNDEVYISALGAIAGQTYDLERVEMLRGPQGTLFGRNATGGLVQIVSAKPTRELDGFLTLTGGSYGQFATEGAISGPLSDRLRARLSFSSDHHGGYIDNAAGKNLGSSKFYAGRIQIAGDVGDSGEFTLKVQGLRNDNERSGGLYSHRTAIPNADGLGEYVARTDDPYGTCTGCDLFGYIQPGTDPFKVAFNGPNYFNRSYWSATLRYVQDLGGVTLTSISDYQHLKKRYAEDADMSPAPIFQYYTAQNLDQYSQELRLSGNDDRMNWVVGGYAIKIKSRNAYNTDLTSIGLGEIYGGTLDTVSFAGFGQLEYALTDQVSLIGGIRYSADRKTYDFTHAENGVTDFTFNRASVGKLARQHFKDYSGKIGVNFKPSDDALLYLSVNRGIKGGGFGTPAFHPGDLSTIPFKEEVLTDYEGGVKLTLGGTSHLNLSAFYYDYKDYQAFELVGISLAIRNKDATIKGLEFEFNTRPVPGLFLQTFATLLDSKVKGVVLPSGRVADTRMPQAPKLSVGALGRYEFDLGTGKLALQTDWKYDSTLYFSTFNAPVDRQSGRIVGNVRASYAFNDRWEVALFANNVTDKAYRLYNLDLSGPFGFTQQSYARPRWIGGSLTYRLGS
ncbi:TonB-dependent receptor [Sphingomonas flavalba]|uniref:TonB-dependent receptor n=1 Tax=Sphingomonas flavalba TaxID=2559804 RepID=UPI0039DF991C